MEDRETFEILTPEKGIKVVLKAWITGREKQKIDSAMFKGVGTIGDGKRLQPKLSETMIADQENASLEAVVVEVNGKTNDLVNEVLNMRVKDYEYVLREVSRIVEGDIPEKKEKSSETNTTESSNEGKVKSQTPESK